jgi:hypothetical protein
MTALLKLIRLLPSAVRLPTLRCLLLCLNAIAWALKILSLVSCACEVRLTSLCKNVVRGPYDPSDDDGYYPLSFPFRMEGPFWR